MKIYQRGFINYRSTKEQKLPKGNLTERLILDFIIKVFKPGLVEHLQLSLQEMDSNSRGTRAAFSIAQVSASDVSVRL
jgi:hypothetical protein